MNKRKKVVSTVDRFLESLTPKQRKEFDQEYQELLLSEMLLAAMEQDDVSVRELAKAAGVSPTIVQGMKSGTRKNISVQSFFKVLNGLGCKMVIEHNGQLYSLDLEQKR